MTEYISFVNAINTITKSRLLRDNKFELIEAFQNIPAADVRPVVLCRDCKWTKTDETDDPAIYCMQWDRWETPPDGFCWIGEKKEE